MEYLRNPKNRRGKRRREERDAVAFEKGGFGVVCVRNNNQNNQKEKLNRKRENRESDI